MGGIHFPVILFAVFLQFVLVACNDSQKVGIAPPQDRFGTTNSGNCSYSPLEGQALATSAVASVYQSSGYFDKELVLGHLSKVMKTSGQQTWRHITDLNIPVYKVPSETNPKCLYFAALDLIPEDLKPLWDSFHRGGGTLLGLYTNLLSRDNTGKVSILTKAIMVREDSERWTLIHEFGHFLFSDGRTRIIGLQFGDELMLRIQQLSEKIKIGRRELAKDPSEAKALQVLGDMQDFFDLSYQLDKQGPLEEFAIESYLLEQFASGELEYISVPKDPENAVRYMRFNGFQVLQSYLSFQVTLRKFGQNELSDQWPKAQKKSEELRQQVTDLIEFIEEKMANAESIIFTQELLTPALGLVEEDASELKQHYDQKLYSELRTLFSRLSDY